MKKENERKERRKRKGKGKGNKDEAEKEIDVMGWDGMDGWMVSRWRTGVIT